ncbi:MAG: acetoin reductase [Lactobacillus sp.]|jgi:meso-butanediol dehydrogenase/(S,S)-butanediol dehydrogenase/diacetyl reductase|nr:acetoin reductase [Lactobacillus sp.]
MTKTAIITGSGQGIGRGIALQLAEDGFNIVVADLNADTAASTAAEIKALGVDSLPLVADVSDAAAFKAMVDEAHEHFPTIDVLVNNAGIAQVGTLEETSAADFDKIFKINVNSVFYGLKAVAPIMRAQGGGKIINAASIAAHQGIELLGPYSATKFAIRGLTQAAAQELAKDHITVNAYAPGIVLTPMWDLIDKRMSEIHDVPIGDSLQKFIDGIALGRGETPQDVAGLVSFLASEKANYITGQTMIVDGGIDYV